MKNQSVLPAVRILMRMLVVTLFLISFVEAQWVQTNGPAGAMVNALVSDGVRLFAGTNGGQVYMSTDQGAGWTRLKLSLGGSIRCIDVSGDTIVVGMDGGGLYRTVHPDSAWSPLSAGIGTNAQVWSVVSFRDDLYASTLTAIYKLPKGSSSWSVANTGIPANIYAISFFVKDTILFAGTYKGGIYTLSPGRSTWQQSNTGLTDTVVRCFASYDTIVYAGTNSSVFRSVDTGKTWTSMADGGFTTVVSLAVLPVNSSWGMLFASSTNGIFSVKTNSTVWSGLQPLATMVLAQASIGTTLFAGGYGGGVFETASGVFVSKDYGQTWAEANSGLTNTSVATIAQYGSNLFAISDYTGVSKSSDDGTTWVLMNPSTANTYSTSIAILDTNLFVGTNRDGIFRSSINSSVWTAVNSGVPTVSIFYATSSYMTSVDTVVYAAFYPSGLYRITKNGTSWSKADSGLPPAKYVISVLSVDTNIYAAAYYGGVYRCSRSNPVWSLISSSISDTMVESFATIGTTLLVGTWKGGMYRSTNGGSSWTTSNTGLPTSWGYYDIKSIAVSGGKVFANVGGFLYFSLDQGLTWTKNSLPTGVYLRTLFAGSSTLYAGTWSDGVWKRTLTDFTTNVITTGTVEPSTFVLSQNYPNPFNPSTVIRYGLPVRSRVRLEIFDLLGRVIETMVDREQEASFFEVSWHAMVPSGIYFYRMVATSINDPSRTLVAVKKMILLK